MSLEVSYKGQQIAQLTSDGSLTLETAGKYCEDDIGLTYSGGGSNPVAEDNDVIFIDYDGTIRYSYTADEFLALTELPPNPHHAGLTAQGWNWTLADAKNQVSDCGAAVIGQNYITSDGKTRIYVELSDSACEPYCGFAINGTAIIEWGDGTSDTVTGSSTTAPVFTQHKYSQGGYYCIAINVASGTVTFTGNATFGPHLLSANDPSIDANAIYRYQILAIELGGNVSFSGHALFDPRGLKTLSIPAGFNLNVGATLMQCVSLQAIVVPSGNTALRSQMLNGGMLSAISLPKSITSISYYNAGLNSSAKLVLPLGLQTVPMQSGGQYRKIVLPSTVQTIENQAIIRSYYLTELTIPSGVTTIGAQAFVSMKILQHLKFKGTTPPVVANINAFNQIFANCIVIVPAEALRQYLTATNYPDPASFVYMGFATYADGEALPSTDISGMYNLTWYARISDAATGTDPITSGNGKEIYCRYTEVSA